MGIGADHQQACRSQRCTRGARSVRRHAVALGAPPSAWGRGGLGRAAPGGAPALAQRRGGHSCSCWQLCWGCESGRLCTQDRALLTIPTLTGSWMRTRTGTRPWTWSSTRVPPSRPSKPRMGPSPDAEVPAKKCGRPRWPSWLLRGCRTPGWRRPILRAAPTMAASRVHGRQPAGAARMQESNSTSWAARCARTARFQSGAGVCWGTAGVRLQAGPRWRRLLPGRAAWSGLPVAAHADQALRGYSGVGHRG